jgi:hypothetical protein
MIYVGKVSGKKQSATYIKELKIFEVTGACGSKLYITPEQILTVIDTNYNVKVTEDELDVLTNAEITVYN